MDQQGQQFEQFLALSKNVLHNWFRLSDCLQRLQRQINWPDLIT